MSKIRMNGRAHVGQPGVRHTLYISKESLTGEEKKKTEEEERSEIKNVR